VEVCYFVVILRLYTRHELKEFLQKVVVVFHPAQLAKIIEVAIYNFADIFVVSLLFVVVDVYHAQRRTYLLARHSLVGSRIRHILCLIQKFSAFRSEFVHLDGNTGHLGSAASHVNCEFDVIPLMDVLGYKMLQV
jgi:hypothetical protein